MLNELLIELNTMFSQCTSLLDGVTKKKMGFFKNKTIDAKKLSEDELKLIAATRSLAGAVKSVIDMPILTSEGVRNIVDIILGAFMTIFIQNILEYNFVLALLTFTTTTLFIMNNNSTSKIFKFIKNICCLRNGISFYIIFYNGSKYIVNMEHYITGSIIVGFISIIIFNISSTKKDK